jgi:hypothetical protein
VHQESQKGGRTRENHGEIKATEKSRKQFQAPSPTLLMKLKTQPHGEQDGPGDSLAIQAAG